MSSAPGHPLYLVNTLTRSKENFVPLHPPHVGVYVCGPTVYSDVHSLLPQRLRPETMRVEITLHTSGSTA
jgi:hypothetical protein